MRALLSTIAGGPSTLVLSDIPVPRPGPGQLLIRTHFAALNFLDSLIIEDRYQSRPQRPFSPGCELSGIVEAVGEGVNGFAPGDRVLSVVGHGALAEYAVADAARSFIPPADMPLPMAAAMPVTYGTTIYALTNRARLNPGDILFVLGGSSGVGLAAIQIGKALGARVVAAVSSDDRSAIAVAAGADDSIVYPHAPLDASVSRDLALRFKQAVAPGGADIIYDAIGGDYCEPALRAIAWGGSYLVIGFAAGIPAIPTNLALLKECQLTGVFWGESIRRNPASFQQQFTMLADLWKQGAIEPQIGRVLPLEEAAAGIAMLSERSIVGKIVIDMLG